jgi:hypothetical protein
MVEAGKTPANPPYENAECGYAVAGGTGVEVLEII